MNPFLAWLELVLEIVRREAFYSLYLTIVAVWFAYMGLRGLVSRETRGLGWRRGPALDREAEATGQVWLVMGATLGAAALFFKLT